MEIRILSAAEYEASKALWEECFHDGAFFTDFYYRVRSKPGYALGAFEGKELISMLHMIPMKMRFGEVISDIAFVAGVCTKPSFRRRGICASLFNEAFPIMRERGFTATALQPFDPKFYERFGYRTFIRRNRAELSYDSPTQPDDRTAISYDRTAIPLLLNLYNGFFKAYDGASVRDEQYFEGFIEEYSAPDARLVITKDGCSAGYSEEDAFVCTELFFRQGADPVSLLPGGFQKYVFPLPPGFPVPEGASFCVEDFGMIKPLVPGFDIGDRIKYGFDRY